MIYEGDNKRGHRVAHYLEERCCIPDSTAENRSALQRRPEVQGLLERKNQDASGRSDLLKSRQGIG